MNWQPIEKRSIPGEHNAMAVCLSCDMDATQTRISRYCIHALDGTPLLCDTCAVIPEQEVWP